MPRPRVERNERIGQVRLSAGEKAEIITACAQIETSTGETMPVTVFLRVAALEKARKVTPPAHETQP